LVNKEYKVEDIFEDIEDDDENILMNIPDEIMEQMGWQEGDVLQFEVEKGSIAITKKQNGKK
jgi:hypothetical protein|tara:strand:- start:52 stop:237 length:186 start_codon:yes stop_codon:yes gene_type:complete